jgi:hypothetical protein
MPTEMHNLGAPAISGLQPQPRNEIPSQVVPHDVAEDFDRIDLTRARCVLNVEFVHVGRGPIRVSEQWEE